MDLHLDRPKLLALNQLEYDFLLRSIDDLDPAELCAADDSGWSIKDHLAHVDAWHRRLLRWFDEGRAGAAEIAPEPGYTWADIDRLNNEDLAARRDRPLAQVLGDLAESFAACQALIASLSEEELTTPGYFAWCDFGPVCKLIAHNTYLHYLGHVGKIRRRRGATGWGRE